MLDKIIINAYKQTHESEDASQDIKTSDMKNKDKGRKSHAESADVNIQKRAKSLPADSKQNSGPEGDQSPEIVILEDTNLTPLQKNLLSAQGS